jgi:beta-lactamase class C
MRQPSFSELKIWLHHYTWRFGVERFCMFRLLLTCLTLARAVANAYGDSNAPDNAIALKQLDQELAGIMATGQTPALELGLVYQGQVLLTRTLGVRVSGNKTLPVDASTRFRLASMSKTFSSVLIGKLVDNSFLRWDTPVNLLVPNFRTRDPNSMFMTVEQLLSHRTGLPHHTLDDELEAASTFAPIRGLLPSAAGECQVGYCFAYQNVSYSFASDVVYAASGQFFQASMQREIFEPLGMTRANFGVEGLQEDDNWARPHERSWRKNIPQVVKPNYYWLEASAGINASLNDMQQWLLALLRHRTEAVPSAVIEAITKPQINTPGEAFGAPWRVARLRGASYGLGIRVFDYLGHPVWFHAGAVAGYRGMVVALPEKDVAMVLMWNNETNLPAGLVPTLLDRWLGLPAHDWLELAKYQPRILPARKVQPRAVWRRRR